jgi:hypothetical protein
MGAERGRLLQWIPWPLSNGISLGANVPDPSNAGNQRRLMHL